MWLSISIIYNAKSKYSELIFTRRLIILTYPLDILILKENTTECDIAKFSKVLGIGSDKIFAKKKNTQKKNTLKNLLELEKRFDINKNLKKLIFENNDENIISMIFENEALIMKFDCDFNREKFKQELASELLTQNWKKITKNSHINLVRKTKIENNLNISSTTKTERKNSSKSKKSLLKFF